MKIKHEAASVIRFLDIYNELNKTNIGFVRPGDPHKKEPDCICSENVAIELVGAYDNQYQASKLWNEARGKKQSKPPELLLSTFDNLEETIANKLEKLNLNKYSGFEGRLFLLCNLHSPLLTDTEVATFDANYVLFKRDNHFERYFDEIWITWQPSNNSNWSIKQLE